jgi:hypothetical protein
MGHIFISYSHKDKKYVEKLEKKLIEEGFDVWIDHRIDYGSQWPKEIQRALDTCDAFVVVVSENAYKSKWVQNEVARADRKGKPFFPLLLEGDAWLAIEAFQYVDVKDGSLPPEKFYKRLEKVSQRKASKTSNNSLHLVPLAKKSKSNLDSRVKVNAFILVILLAIISYFIPQLVGSFVLSEFQNGDSPLAYSTVTSTNTPKIISTSTPVATQLPAKTFTITSSPTVEYKAGDTWTRPTDGMVMSYIPAGEFQMGSEDGDDDEKPVHTVYLDAFWMDQTEITNAMYFKCTESGECSIPNGALC